MKPNRNDHLRYRYGICLNDKCSKCKEKEIQQIPARKDFVCSECEKSLRECAPPKSFGQKYGKLIGILAAVVVIAGIVILLLLPSSGDNIPEETLQATDSTSATVTEEAVTEVPAIDSSAIKAYNDSIKLAKADSILKAQQVTKPAEKTNTASSAQTQPQSTSHKLSYGTWTGGWKNGKPHGTGTLTYSTSQTIDSRDPKARVAQPGEYIVGEWDNGHLVQGRWFKNDGTKEAIIIGKVG